MAVGSLLALHVGVSAILLLHAVRGLVINDDSTGETEYYVAPATFNRKDGKALPSTIIISRPLGLRTDPHKGSEKEEEKEKDDDFTEGSFSVIPQREETPGKGEVSVEPNIQFYKIECSKGRSCTAIIPARTTTISPPSIPFTKLELKKYLSQFGLYNGFPYDDDFEATGSPEPIKENEGAKYFNKHAGINHSVDRAFGTNNRNYWPGSEYRPGNQPSRGQVFKYQGSDSHSEFPTQSPFPNFSTSRPSPDFQMRPIEFPTQYPSLDTATRSPVNKWDKFTADLPIRKPDNKWGEVRPLPNDRFHGQHSHELPSPFGYEDDSIRPPNGPPRPPSPIRTTTRPTTYDGVWNRYSMSTVSQLDKDTGEWVKVSSSSTRLDHGLFNLSEDGSPSPPGPLPPATHHTKASLTVLGISDREPLSAFGDSDANKPHVLSVPSANPGSPPEMIETDGGLPDGLRRKLTLSRVY
ncbi:uncharacterized protein LOC135209172 [Macrobrachium nipponense]|uniref:uncharacterized protein LOC135209172 n=1 Tax=Macrobrachium nipponense TaxID=159736 RepID=UPI0030C8291C